MLAELIIALVVAGLAFSGWVLAEFELRDAHRELDDIEYRLDVALGWQETQAGPVAHSTLHVIEGGEMR